MNSKPQPNWTELPVEMQWECIKHLDFKSRMRLRATSKTDKSVVESAPKHHFDSVEIKWSSWKYPYTVKYRNGADEFKLEYDPVRTSQDESFLLEKGTQLALQILKFSDAETLIFKPEFIKLVVAGKFLSEIANSTPFRFKNLQLYANDFDVAHFFLKHCKNVETIKLTSSFAPKYKLKNEKMMQLPSVINAKEYQNRTEQSPESACKLVEKWIEHDAEIGRTLQVIVWSEDDGSVVEAIVAKFQDRIIYQKAGELRLRTDNESKHILVRAVMRGNYRVSFVFIPPDLLESEYEKDYDWAVDDDTTISPNFDVAMGLLMAHLADSNAFRELAAMVGDEEPDAFSYEDYLADM